MLMQYTVASGKSNSMGRGEHLDSNKRHIVRQKSLREHDNITGFNSLVCPLRTCSLLRSIPDLPSHGGGLECSC